MTSDPADLRRMADAAFEAWRCEPSVLAWERFKAGLLRLERVDAIAVMRLLERVKAERQKGAG